MRRVRLPTLGLLAVSAACVALLAQPGLALADIYHASAGDLPFGSHHGFYGALFAFAAGAVLAGILLLWLLARRARADKRLTGPSEGDGQ